MTNKIIRQNSNCANCEAEKSRFWKKKFNLKMQKEKKKRRGNVELILWKTNNSTKFFLSKCAAWSSKKSRFIKEQEAKGILGKILF